MINKGFIAGFVCALALQSMFASYLGLERFVEFCRKHWVALPWWLWLLLFFGILCLDMLSALDAKRWWSSLSDAERERFARSKKRFIEQQRDKR